MCNGIINIKFHIVSTMQPWKVKMKTGGVKRKALKEYNDIIKSTQNRCSKPSLINEKYDDIVVTREGLLVDCDMIPGSSSDVNTNYYPNDLGYNLYQAQATNIQEGSVQQDIYITESEDNILCPLSSSNTSDDEQDDMHNINFKNDLRSWALEKNISQAALKDLLLILNKRFTNILPSDPRTILQTPTEICLKTIEDGEYWHHGVIKPLSNILENCTPLPKTIHLNINLDGLPIFKSSKYEFWPILADVYELVNGPFIIGIYFGKGKPKNLNSFLEDFVNEISTVLKEGVCIRDMNVTVKIRCFICDSPARAFIKGM